MKPSLVDVPVALVFFNRPEPLAEVFDAIRFARPSKLFLIQDGARQGKPDDAEKVKRCREIVQTVDWDCEVHSNFAAENLGCGSRVYSGISWAFGFVDRLCIIEDDCKPSPDFFRFCAELLDRFADDERVDMISGMNNLGTYSVTPYSYIFSETGSIWGWATWKRAWSTVDYEMGFLDDPDAVRLLRNSIKPKRLALELLKSGQIKKDLLLRGGTLTSWSYQRGMNMYLHSGLIIVPRVNLVSNIGLTQDSVHAVDSFRKLPRALRPLFFMPFGILEFPLTHPPYVVRDAMFDARMNELMNPNRIIRSARRAEGVARRLFAGR